MSTAVQARTLRVAVRDQTVLRALQFVAGESGWAIEPNAPVLATDHIGRWHDHEGRVVLVITPVPAACRMAVAGVTAGTVHSVVTTDDVDELARALELAVDGICSIPEVVIAMAEQSPCLSERELTVLGAVMAGQSNAAIARATYLSQATIKRVITELLRTFGVTNRSALTASAAMLGYSACRIVP